MAFGVLARGKIRPLVELVCWKYSGYSGRVSGQPVDRTIQSQWTGRERRGQAQTPPPCPKKQRAVPGLAANFGVPQSTAPGWERTLCPWERGATRSGAHYGAYSAIEASYRGLKGAAGCCRVQGACLDLLESFTSCVLSSFFLLLLIFLFSSSRLVSSPFSAQQPSLPLSNSCSRLHLDVYVFFSSFLGFRLSHYFLSLFFLLLLLSFSLSLLSFVSALHRIASLICPQRNRITASELTVQSGFRPLLDDSIDPSALSVAQQTQQNIDSPPCVPRPFLTDSHLSPLSSSIIYPLLCRLLFRLSIRTTLPCPLWPLLLPTLRVL